MQAAGVRGGEEVGRRTLLSPSKYLLAGIRESNPSNAEEWLFSRSCRMSGHVSDCGKTTWRGGDMNFYIGHFLPLLRWGEEGRGGTRFFDERELVVGF